MTRCASTGRVSSSSTTKSRRTRDGPASVGPPVCRSYPPQVGRHLTLICGTKGGGGTYTVGHSETTSSLFFGAPSEEHSIWEKFCQIDPLDTPSYPSSPPQVGKPFIRYRLCNFVLEVRPLLLRGRGSLLSDSSGKRS